MTTYVFQGTNIDCQVKTNAVNGHVGQNITIMHIDDKGTTKVAHYFDKGKIYNENTLKAVATLIGGSTTVKAHETKKVGTGNVRTL